MGGWVPLLVAALRDVRAVPDLERGRRRTRIVPLHVVHDARAEPMRMPLPRRRLGHLRRDALHALVKLRRLQVHRPSSVGEDWRKKRNDDDEVSHAAFLSAIGVVGTRVYDKGQRGNNNTSFTQSQYLFE